uniref:Uncharacterized protein n=1 Tax=Rhizophora mucronata TaxID=61149 RepID=A0A2P2N215_RHIMU
MQKDWRSFCFFDGFELSAWVIWEFWGLFCLIIGSVGGVLHST